MRQCDNEANIIAFQHYRIIFFHFFILSFIRLLILAYFLKIHFLKNLLKLILAKNKCRLYLHDRGVQK